MRKMQTTNIGSNSTSKVFLREGELGYNQAYQKQTDVHIKQQFQDKFYTLSMKRHLFTVNTSWWGLIQQYRVIRYKFEKHKQLHRELGVKGKDWRERERERVPLGRAYGGFGDGEWWCALFLLDPEKPPVGFVQQSNLGVRGEASAACSGGGRNGVG